MTFLLRETYESGFGADAGFDFQDELLLHFCLMMRRMRCTNFAAGYEVKELFPKFDDVVCEFKYGDTSYLLPLQAKFVLQDKKKLSEKRLLSENGPFSLGQYISEILNTARNVDKEERVLKFILITTLSMDMENIHTLNDDDPGVKSLFSEMTAGENGAKILRFGGMFQKNIETVLEKLNSKDKIFDEKELDEYANYIRKHLIFVTNSPNIEQLQELNDKLMKEVEVLNHESFFEIVRKKVLQFIQYDSSTKKRKVLTESNFETIIMNSLLEVDLLTIANSFTAETPLLVEFNEESLNRMSDNISNVKNISVENEDYAKILAFKIFQLIKRNDPNVILMPISKMSETQMAALSCYDKRIIILVDDDQYLPSKENVILVGKLDRSIPILRAQPFHYSDLTENAQSEFLEKSIQIQNYPTLLYKIVSQGIDSRGSINLLNKIFLDMFNEKMVMLGKDLPKYKIPNIYIQRKFKIESSDEIRDYVDESDLFMRYTLCFIKGSPGMGKSSTLQNMAINFKKQNPHFWIEFFDLKLLSRVFMQKLESKSLDFTHYGAEVFVWKNLLARGKNEVLDQQLVRYYFAKSETPIILIFDGFDEIMPTYERLVLNLVKKLAESNARIFISGRQHSTSILSELTGFQEVEIEPYSDYQINAFTEDYFRAELPNKGPKDSGRKWLLKHTEIVKKIFSKISKRTTPESLSTPLFLKMVADISLHEHNSNNYYQEVSETSDRREQIDDLWLYDKMFELSFKSFYEKEGIDPTSNYAISRENVDIKRVKRVHAFFAAKELDFQFLFASRNDLEDSCEVDILGRGFLTRTDDDQYFFIHRTFAEYFCAGKLVVEVEENNETAVEHLAKIDDTSNTKIFVYQMIILKIREYKMVIIPIERMEILPNRDILLKFLNSLTKYSWQVYLPDFPTTLEFLWRYFPIDGLKFFDYEDIIGKLLDSSFDSTSEYHSQQFKSLYSYRHREDFDNNLFSEFSITLECELIRIAIKRWNERRFDKVYNKIIESAVTKEYFLDFIFNETRRLVNLDKCNRKIDILIWYFQKKLENSDDSSVEFIDEFRSVRRNYSATPFYKAYVLAIEIFSRKTKNETFFVNIIDKIVNDDEFFDFLSIFEELYDPNFKDVEKKYVNTILKKGRKKILSNRSLLFELWNERKCKLFSMVLENYNKKDIEILTQSPYFKGASLLEFYRLKEKKAFMMESWINYVFEYYGGDEVLQYLCPYNEDVDISLSIRKDLTLCVCLSWSATKDLNAKAFLEKVIAKVCENILDWESDTGKKVNLFHNIARVSFNDCECVLQLIFEYLQNKKNIIENKLLECDDKGTIPIQICGSEMNLLVFRYYEMFAKDRILKLLENCNKENQNFFHFFGKNSNSLSRKNIISFVIYLNNIFVDKKEILTKLLIQQDCKGRTPLHRVEAFDFFDYLISFVTEDKLKNLIITEDDRNNNIFHYMARNLNNPNRYRYMFYKFSKNPSVFENLKQALLTKNSQHETPIDIGKRLEFRELLTIWEDILNDRCKSWDNLNTDNLFLENLRTEALEPLSFKEKTVDTQTRQTNTKKSSHVKKTPFNKKNLYKKY